MNGSPKTPVEPPASLQISPNLDLLLQYDDNMRGIASTPPTSGNSYALRPRPRGNTVKTPTSPLSRSPLTPGTPISPGNPYINAAPSFRVSEKEKTMDAAAGPKSGIDTVASGWDDSRSRGNEVGSTGQPTLGLPSIPSVLLKKKTVRNRSSSSGSNQRVKEQRNSGNSMSTRQSSDSSLHPRSSASIDEPRISISSTLYSESHNHFSLPDSFYSPMQSNHDYSRISRSISVTSRDSFIDFDGQTSPLPEPEQPAISKKPPVPLAPKPAHLSSRMSRHQSRSRSPHTTALIPPTTNLLNPVERADLIRKSKKLAKVFGQTPGAEWMAESNEHIRHRRGAASISTMAPVSQDTWPLEEGTQYLTASGRRHSSPLASDDFPFLQADGRTTNSHRSIHSSIEPDSPTSFMNLTDEEAPDSAITPKSSRQRVPSSPSVHSLFENLSPVEQAEQDRRRKREKLARVHRFLGSRVPANLVLNIPERVSSLPPASPMLFAVNDDYKSSIRRRRSSSAAVLSSSWVEDLDKHELDEKEKAAHVRRATKMAKVFGEAPPQTLYTSHSPSSSSNGFSTTNSSIIKGPSSSSRSTARQSAAASQPSTSSRQRNKPSYSTHKLSSNASSRPGTAESAQLLIPHSTVYNHYQHSLNSLNDIIDRDDKESLAELREYLDSDESPPARSPVLQEFARDRRQSVTTSIKSERRRSLPARTSMLSLSSEYSISSPTPEVTAFQLKRRRAAKLQHFFGEDYNMLIGDVLESIEKGVEEERKRGTLNPDEFNDLVKKLRNLKTKRDHV